MGDFVCADDECQYEHVENSESYIDVTSFDYDATDTDDDDDE